MALLHFPLIVNIAFSWQPGNSGLLQNEDFVADVKTAKLII